MMLFNQASTKQQSVIMIAMLIILILSLLSSIVSLTDKKSKIVGYINIILFLLISVVLTILANIFYQINEKYISETIFLIPVSYLWVIILITFVFLIYEMLIYYCKGDEYLGSNSIKQAMDMLPCAVCYFSTSGTVKLCNLQMYRLFHNMAKKELQSLDDLIQALNECDNKNGIIRLSDVRQTYLFPDGKVWRYSQSEIIADGETYTEALFSDVTDLYEKNLELQRQTVQLEKISRDIKQLSDNVQTLAKEKETLIAKSKLHDQMGTGLLAIRQILRQKKTSEENSLAVKQFRQAIMILQQENTHPLDDIAEFIEDAAVSGIQVEIMGELPTGKNILYLLLPILREACVNAARHADATSLYVDSTIANKSVTIVITNDGKVPDGEIVPRGGLANFQKHIAEVGGNMQIQSQPIFKLIITLPVSEQNN